MSMLVRVYMVNFRPKVLFDVFRIYCMKVPSKHIDDVITNHTKMYPMYRRKANPKIRLRLCAV